eukprot:gene7812-8658_t
MSLTRPIVESSFLVAVSAGKLKELYNKLKFGGHPKPTPITFDQLRNNISELKLEIAKSTSYNERVRCILHSFEVPVTTFRDFTLAVLKESWQEKEDIQKELDMLMEQLNGTVHLMGIVKAKLGDHTHANPVFTSVMEQNITEKMQRFYPGLTRNEVVDIRNYVLFNEIIITSRNLTFFLSNVKEVKGTTGF